MPASTRSWARNAGGFTRSVRGLPAPPSDVVRVEAMLDVNGDVVTTGWWVFAPGADVATTAQLETLLGDVFIGPCAPMLSLLSTDTQIVNLRCVTFGASALQVDLQPVFNIGALDGTTALNSALVWTWMTGVRAHGSRTHNWLPLSRSNLGADKRRLSGLGFAEAVRQAINFRDELNAVHSPDGGLCVLVALHRSSGGVPLVASQMLPVQAAKASPIVGTLQRRTATAPRAPSTL